MTLKRLGLDLGLGLTKPKPLPLSGGGGGSGYVAKAVHFDGSTWFTRPPLVGVVNSPTGLISGWFKLNNDAGLAEVIFGNANFDCQFNVNNNGDGTIVVSTNLYDAPNTSQIAARAPYFEAQTAVWVPVQYSWDMNHPPGERLLQIGINGEIYDAEVVSESGGAFDVEIAGYDVSFFSDNDGENFIGDAADFYMRVGGSFFDLRASNPFIAAGKPTNPSTWPAGGHAIFSGDSTSFATNQGSGGSVTVVGSLTNATTSPSD